MLTKRIIPCLDIDNGRVKKGINFVNLIDIGDPALVAHRYQEQGADELVFLDISATIKKNKTTIQTINEVAQQVFIPLTVGGGIKSLTDIKNLLNAGADKISINSEAVKNPTLITEGAKKFGAQCIVVAIDCKYDANTQKYQVYTAGGTQKTDLDAIKWAQKAVDLGAGELLITSIDQDGTKNGYDLALYQAITQSVSVPVIASGGCGNLADFTNLFQQTRVDGALAASVFHKNELTIPSVKENLSRNGVEIR